jgi:hypothetical protein
LDVGTSSVDELPGVPTAGSESGVAVAIDIPKRPRSIVAKSWLYVDDRDAIADPGSRKCTRETEAREPRTEDGEAIRRPIAGVHRFAVA